jgi:hypothetical protein
MKVFVSMVERLTGRPVRMVDASDWPSMNLDYPPPERPPALSDRSDWEVSLGQMSVADTKDGGSAVVVSAVVGSSSPEQVSVSLTLTPGFVAETRGRVEGGRSPLTDPVLVSAAGSIEAMRAGASSFVLDVDQSKDGGAVLRVAQNDQFTAAKPVVDQLVNPQAFASVSSVAAAVNLPVSVVPQSRSFPERAADSDDRVNVDLSV